MTPVENVMQRACIFLLPCLFPSFFLSGYFRQMPRVPAVSVAGLGCKFQRWEHSRLKEVWDYWIQIGQWYFKKNSIAGSRLLFYKPIFNAACYPFLYRGLRHHLSRILLIIHFDLQVHLVSIEQYQLTVLPQCLVCKKVIDGSIKNCNT